MAHQVTIPRLRPVEAAVELLIARTHLGYITRDEVRYGVRTVYLTTPHATDSDLRVWAALEALTSPHHDVSLFTLGDHLDDQTKQAVADAIVTLFQLREAVPA